MSFVGSLVRSVRGAITSSAELDQALRGGHANAAGAVLTTESALTVSAVFACVRVLAEGIAQIPLLLMERTAEGRERAANHWAYRLLHDTPNPWQTSFAWREQMMAHLALRGNAYAIKTVVRGETRELLPIGPERVTQVTQDDRYRITYTVAMPGGTTLSVPEERMLHIRGLSWNGLTGLSVLSYMREVLGVAIQEQRYAGKLYGNGAAIRGVIQHPKTLKKESVERLRAQFDEVYSGVENAHKVMILEEDAKFAATGMTAQDAEFLTSRKYTRSEVAGWFRVPLHMIGDLERSTNNNIEHQSLDLVKFTLAPWAVRIEQQIARSVLSGRERERYYPRFVLEGLERGDLKSRVDAYGKAIKDGWMNRNEVREREDLNRVEGLDEFLTPLYLTDGSDNPDRTDKEPPTT